jgi:LysR family transcriptional regulator, chromosome initiation inhibitor
MQLDSRQLAAFAAVLREGSFEGAANALFVTPSAISQRIKQLEDRLGRVLIQRSSPCVATAAGQALQRHAQQVQLLEAQALAAFGIDSETSAQLPVAIAVNADSLATWLAPALARTQAAHGCTFDLIVEDQHHSNDLLHAGRVMGAITTDAHAVQGCNVLPLGAMRYVAVASPIFFDRFFASGVNDASLAVAPCNVFNRKDGLQSSFLKTIAKKRLNPPHHFVPSTHGFVEAALHGLGWGMNPLSLVTEHLKRGTLRELKRNKPLDVPLYWQHWRLDNDVLRRLTQEIGQAASERLVRLGKASVSAHNA